MGRVSPTLIPPVQLYQIIQRNERLHGLKSLVGENDFNLIYPLLKTSLYHKFVIISVPFQSQDAYTLYKMHPFPVEMDGSYFLYNLEHPNIIVNDDLDMYSHPSDEVLTKCYHTHLELFLCPSFLFTFYTPTERPCEISIIKSLEYKSECVFKEYTSVEPFIAHTEQLHYIHLPKKTAITVKCPSKSVKMSELKGTFILPTTCTLLSNEVHIFPHHIYLEYANVRLPSPEIFVIKSKVFDSPPGNVSTTSDLIKEKIHLERKFIKIQRGIFEEVASSSPVDASIKKHIFYTAGFTTLIISIIITFGGIACFCKLKKRLNFLAKLKAATLHPQSEAENSDHEHQEEEED